MNTHHTNKCLPVQSGQGSPVGTLQTLSRVLVSRYKAYNERTLA